MEYQNILIQQHFYCSKCHDEFLASEDDAELYDNGYCEPICDDCGEESEYEEDYQEFTFFDQELGF